MIAAITHHNKKFEVDLSKPLDISMPLVNNENASSAWYVAPMQITPVSTGTWVGDVNQGGSVNFRTITFNPHGNGTHTECVGHISKEWVSINQCLTQFIFVCKLISLTPSKIGDDWVIEKNQIENLITSTDGVEALVIRTLPNTEAKLHINYSNTNPPYIHHEAITYLNNIGIKHLLIDLPSVDKEVDGGKLLAHQAFWQYPHNTQFNKTITELIYVANNIKDGTYLLNLQIASFENDASPSKPVLYHIMTI